MKAMKMIQVRNVPDEVHRKLKIRAAERGVTLSRLVYDAVIDYAERPTWEDFERKLAAIPHTGGPGGPSGAELVWEARRERDRELARRTNIEYRAEDEE